MTNGSTHTYREPARPLCPGSLFLLGGGAAALIAAMMFGVVPAAALDGDLTLFDAECETARIRPGDPEYGWTLLEGMKPTSRGRRTFARADGTSALLLVLRAGEARELSVVARAARPGLRLRPSINDVGLEAREVSRSWSTLTWAVPAGVIRDGANVLRLGPEADGEHARALKYAVKLITLESSRRCRAERERIEISSPTGPVFLRPGSTLIREGSWAPRSRLDLRLTTRWPDTQLAASCYTTSSANPLVSVTGGSQLRALEFAPLQGSCASGRGLGFFAAGPEWVRVDNLEVTQQGDLAWRKVVGRNTTLLVLVLAVAVAAPLVLTKRSTPERIPWTDLLLVLVIALAARAVFFSLYPFPGFAADSYEYLLRARFLMSGEAGFLADTSWHAWQTFLRPPGYFLFLASALGSGPEGSMPVLWWQLVLSALPAAALYLVAYPLFGRTAALLSGLTWAVFLGSITTFSRIMPEPLYLALVVPALAALTWTALRPRRSTAFGAGLLLGLGEFVRSGPLVFVALAGGLMLALFGLRRGLRLAGFLAAGAFLVVLPWIVRNSLVSGRLVGVSDVSIANLMLSHPDKGLAAPAGFDLDTEEGRTAFQQWVPTANSSGELSGAGLRLTKNLVGRMAASPIATLKRFGSSLTQTIRPVPDHYLRVILRDHDRLRMAWLTSATYAQNLLILGFGVLGLIASLANRRAWPLILWFAFYTAVIHLFFFHTPRFDLQTMPVAIVFMAASVVYLGKKLRAGWRSIRGDSAPCL